VISEIAASAPGKVLLSGEYAVLDGAPAICMAVDRRARAVVAHASGDISRVTASGYKNASGCFRSTDGRIEWQNGQATFRVVDSVWRVSGAGREGARAINLDTTEFIDSVTQCKIGIGSSSAITVALCAAVNNSADIAALTMIAQRAHADLQEGAGSGVDIACSLHGGLIEYRIKGASVTALQWPEGLSYRLIWTGVAASTREKLAKLAAGVSKPSRVRLACASEDMAIAWRSGAAKEIVAAYREYGEHLHQFSVDHDLGIFDAGHDELWQAASSAGLGYKPCGAGGGDIGILLGMDDVELDVFTGTLSQPYSVLDCELSPAGVRIGA